jgi:hypothetical protein
MSTAIKLSFVLALCWGVTLSSDQGRGSSKKDNGGPHAAGYERDANHDKDKDRDSYFERHGYKRLKIPPGHYPAPGECRIWYPGRPPGHQPPPVRCERLGRIPAGAWVIRHPHDNPDHVHVVVYDERRPESVFVVGEFRIATGVFVRVVVDR